MAEGYQESNSISSASGESAASPQWRRWRTGSGNVPAHERRGGASTRDAEGEVLDLLEIEGGVPPLLRNQKPMPVGAGTSKEAPHDDENTVIDAHAPIPFRPD